MFLLGSCRIWKATNKNGCTDTDSVIQAHYSHEIHQIINWLSQSKVLTEKEQKSFRKPMTAENWEKCIASFKSAQFVLVEISSIKISEYNGVYCNLLNAHPSVVSTGDVVAREVDLIDKLLVSMGKIPIYFCHVNVYSDKHNGLIYNRTCIQEMFKKKPSLNFIDPSAVVSEHGKIKCLVNNGKGYDHNHYTEFMEDLIFRQIKNITLN